jgi:hypothetical protein
MEGLDALTLRTSAGMYLARGDSYDSDDEDVPSRILISTICLGFEVDSEYFGDANHMAYPSVSELGTFIRMAGLILR